MSLSTEARMHTLLQHEQGKTELKTETTSGIFRIDLKPENLRLWRETLLKYSMPCNLLLACESNQGGLSETKLTWVVGSAIRATQITSPNKAVKLLESMGIQAELAELAKKQCPGLGEEITWAFYLERHGWLTASPVLTTTQIKSIQCISPTC